MESCIMSIMKETVKVVAKSTDTRVVCYDVRMDKIIISTLVGLSSVIDKESELYFDALHTEYEQVIKFMKQYCHQRYVSGEDCRLWFYDV